MSDFSVAPDFVVEEEPVFNTLISQFENGAEQRRSKWSTPIRKWRLEFKYKTQTEMNVIKDFFVTKLGALTAFTWTNPIDSTEYNVRFQEDSITIKMIAYDIYNISLTFVSVK